MYYWHHSVFISYCHIMLYNIVLFCDKNYSWLSRSCVLHSAHFYGLYMRTGCKTWERGSRHQSNNTVLTLSRSQWEDARDKFSTLLLLWCRKWWDILQKVGHDRIKHKLRSSHLALYWVSPFLKQHKPLGEACVVSPGFIKLNTKKYCRR